MAAQVLVNGKAYSYVQLVIGYLGVALNGVTSIDYEETQEKTNNYANGEYAVSRGYGKVETTGTIELSMNVIEALRDAAPDRSLLKIPSSDMVLTFGNSQKVVTHVLKNMEFTTDGGGGADGDTDLRKSLGIIFSHVQYNG